MTGDVIVQLFDQPFGQVQKALPRLQKLGFRHILVSPPQKSHASRSWWGRYQPVDFRVIDGPLGNQAQLAALCHEASARGMSVVADAVLHHMSNEGRYLRLSGSRIAHAQYPRFSTPDFQPRAARLGRGRGLPALNTRSPWVRSELRDYLRLLYRLGVRGFRFDAAKHLEPELFDYLLEGMPPLLCFGEIVYAQARDFPAAYFKHLKGYDFPLAHALKTAFAPGGDLGSLVQPDALWGPTAVTFVNHHDLIKKRRDMAYFRVEDKRDRALAQVFVLARADGTPLVYGGDLKEAEVRAGVDFHNRSMGQPQSWVQVNPTLLAWRRGDRLLAALNKAGQEWSPGWVETGLAPGRYRDLLSGSHHAVDPRGRWLTARVAARSALLLVPG